MKLLPRPRSTTWRDLLGAAALGSAATLLISRNFFVTEKKIRHPIETDYGIDDDVFTRVMGQLLGPPLLEGNRVKILQNGDEIFPAMLAGIRSAKRTITFENFLFKEGRISREFAEALAERARAGVKVHFLQDAIGCDCVWGDAIKLMRRCGVEVQIFPFMNWTRFNFRTHRKLLIIDGTKGFIGGVGISDDWEGDGQTAGYWRDTHYELEGPAVAQMQQSFMDNWMQTRAAVLHGDAYFPKLQRAGDYKCQVFKSSAHEGADSARMMFLFSLAAARRSHERCRWQHASVALRPASSGNVLPHICERAIQAIRPAIFCFQGRRCQSSKVTSRERLLSSSKIRVCSAANAASRIFRFASSLRRSERLSKLAEPTDTQRSSAMRYLQW